ncbi:MAG TPA: hypothetical protein VLJ60_06105, partial [bacterium]|nr:hypothetical protein [bacterium]
MKQLITILFFFLAFSGCKVNDETLPDQDNLKTDTEQPVTDTDSANVPDETNDKIMSEKEADEDSFYEPDESPDPDHITVLDDESDIEIFDEDADNSICPNVEKPVSPSEDPLSIVADFGTYESVTNSGFTDHFLYSNSAKQFKIGVREQWGSSIVFLGFSNNVNSNVIDANDTGREVQIAIYDPDRIMQNCAHNASCATTPTECAGSITFLGWNPVQGGNRCNNGSPTESISGVNGEMIASVVPYQWNPAWDRSDCFSDICSDNNYKNRLSDMRYIQRIRWVGANVVEIKMTIHNLTNIERRATLQEFP